MKRYAKTFIAALTATLLILALSATTFAGSLSMAGSSPSSKDGVPPYGLNAQENAKGAKLNGVLQISFTSVSCNAAWEVESGSCSDFGPNAADARVSLRLSTTDKNNESLTKSFYKDLGQMPIFSVELLQEGVMNTLRPMILNAFFDADCNEAIPVNCSQQIFIKSFTGYSEGNISTAPVDDEYAQFTAMADIILAVD